MIRRDFVWLDRSDKWAPALWIGMRCITAGRSNCADQPWPVYFMTWRLGDIDGGFSFPKPRKRWPT